MTVYINGVSQDISFWARTGTTLTPNVLDDDITDVNFLSFTDGAALGTPGTANDLDLFANAFRVLPATADGSIFLVRNLADNATLFSVDTSTPEILAGTNLNMGANTINNVRQIESRDVNGAFLIKHIVGGVGADRDIAFQTQSGDPVPSLATRLTIEAIGAGTPDISITAANLNLNENNILQVDELEFLDGSNNVFLKAGATNRLDMLVSSGGAVGLTLRSQASEAIITGGATGGDGLTLRGSTSTTRPQIQIIDGASISAVLSNGSIEIFQVTDDNVTPDVLLQVRETNQSTGIQKLHVIETAVPSLDTDVIFQVDSTVAAAVPAPVMTTGQRDAIGTPSEGMQIFNSTTNVPNFYNGTAWTSAGGSAPSESDFVFAYETGTQAISLANTFQDLTFAVNGQLDGWTHSAASADFTCAVTGKYLVSVVANFEKTAGGGSGTAQMRTLFNATEVAGSELSTDLTANGASHHVSRTFIIDATATQVLKVEIAGDSTNISLIAGPDPGTRTTNVSASISITRLT